MLWLWWVAGALVLCVVEMVSLSLFLLMLAGGALVAAAASALGAPLWVQVLLASLVSLALIAGLRPWLLRHLRTRGSVVETNAAALVGVEAMVVASVTELGGRVKVRGEVWSARASRDGAVYAPGLYVRVVRIEGATAVVQDDVGTAQDAAGQQGPARA
jgi:membrane protein implicated in regulation of membrane protease activity